MVKVNKKKSYQKAELDHTVPGLPVPSQWAKTGSNIYSKARGNVLTTIDGTEYLDSTSCGLTNIIGYNRQELADVAREQMLNLYHVPNFGGSYGAHISLETLLSHCRENLRLKMFVYCVHLIHLDCLDVSHECLRLIQPHIGIEHAYGREDSGMWRYEHGRAA